MPPGQGREFPRPCLECVDGARLQGLDPFLFSPPPVSRPLALQGCGDLWAVKENCHGRLNTYCTKCQA